MTDVDSTLARDHPRRFELVDSAAEAWFGSRGFRTAAQSPLTLCGDVFVTPQLGLARVWHTPAALERRRSRAFETMTLIIALEGELLVDGVALEPDDCVLVSSRDDLTLASAVRSARVELTLPGRFLERHSLPRPTAPLRGGSGMVDLLVTVANTLLSASDLSQDDVGWPHAALGVEYLVQAAYEIEPEQWGRTRRGVRSDPEWP